MAEIIIKIEEGKEVAYEKGILFDTKIGELHETWTGDKVSTNIFGPEIRVSPPGFFSREREAAIKEGENIKEGVISKGFFENHPTFKPRDESPEPETNAGSNNSSYEGVSPDRGLVSILGAVLPILGAVLTVVAITNYRFPESKYQVQQTQTSERSHEPPKKILSSLVEKPEKRKETLENLVQMQKAATENEIGYYQNNPKKIKPRIDIPSYRTYIQTPPPKIFIIPNTRAAFFYPQEDGITQELYLSVSAIPNSKINSINGVMRTQEKFSVFLKDVRDNKPIKNVVIESFDQGETWKYIRSQNTTHNPKDTTRNVLFTTYDRGKTWITSENNSEISRK